MNPLYDPNIQFDTLIVTVFLDSTDASKYF